MMNPFTPNFGQVPAHIAGRSREIGEVLHALDGNPGSPANTSIFVGARGSGKTALLTYLAEEGQKLGWISVSASCMPGMQEDILLQATRRAGELVPTKGDRKITGVSIGNLIGVDWETAHEMKPNWRMQMTLLLEALEEFNTGILITIDEVNPKVEEMIQIAAIYQLLIRERRKVALLMAGLPSKISSLLNHEAVSFLRRASQYTLEPLETFEVEAAFRKTVEDGGKTVTDSALKDAAGAIGGYPYLLQLVGYHAWEAAGSEAKIHNTAIREGIDLARKDFESRVLKATVNELSDGDLQFLYAMLPDEEYSKNADLKERLHKSEGHISLYRARLIESGVIQSAGRGKLTFAIPGLRDYLKRNWENI